MRKNRLSSDLTLLATIIAAAPVLLVPQFSVRAQGLAPGAQFAPPVAYSKVVPLTGASDAAVHLALASGTTVPMWNFSLTSPVDGNSYSGVMVGRSPFFHGARTTNIAAVIVPLIVKMPDGGVFNPTAADPCSQSHSPLALVQESPLLQTASFSMNGTSVGTTQYVDAFQRANFWEANVSITGNRYHTMLSPVTSTNAATFAVPSGMGATYSTAMYGGCGDLGVVDFSTMDNFVRNTLIPGLASQGVSSTVLPIIILGNVVLGDPGDSLTSNCCVIGYHGAYGSPVQTYALSDYDSTSIFLGLADVSALGHEIGEWEDDPLGNNPTPAWGHVGQVSGCQNNLEVGDPLSGTLFSPISMPNGVTYHTQELAFFSWFYRQSPSLGAGGVYSDNGTFDTGAGAVCQ